MTSDSLIRPLLTVKQLVPPVRSGAVPRTRLEQQLRDARTPLTIVVAPAGWGKTSLLSAWAAAPGPAVRVSWVSLDAADDEPIRFWRYVLSALGDAGAAALDALGRAGDPIELALPMLLNELAASTAGHVLVLDDYHVLGDRRIHESVEFLVSYLPAALRLVLAARADPPLPIARMRARGQLTELRAVDLEMSVDEAAALVSAVSGRSLNPAELAAVWERTEGWAAGLQLAALALRESRSLRAADFGGGARCRGTCRTAELVYPVTSWVTGASLALRPDWPWLLIGIFAFHGVAEELVWRGYAYRRLRADMSFGRAVLWTMPLVAVAHLPIFITSGPLVAGAALIVAAVTSVPLAYLFDTGRGTIWAPAVLHTAIDSFKLVLIPASAVMTFSLLLAAVSIVIPLLVLLVPRRVFQAGPTTGFWFAVRRPVGLLVLAGVLFALATALDTGSAAARDAALLIGAPALWVLLPLAAGWLIVAVVRYGRRCGLTASSVPEAGSAGRVLDR